MQNPNPDGLCLCGCGQKTTVPKTTNRYNGRFKGVPLAFVHGHHARVQPRRRANLVQYIEEDRGFVTPCWIWQRTTDGDGRYGAVRENGRMQRAHRVYWERRRGPVPDGKELDHLCRTTLCVNPDHLEPVTHAENGRRGNQTKLTEEIVREIRRIGRSVSGAELARRFGVDRHTIYDILRGRTWQGVGQEG